MLTELQRLIDENQGEIELNQLSKQLGAQPSAVAGMLHFLIRKGRIQELGVDCGSCDSCGFANDCLMPVSRARRLGLSEVVREQG